VSEELQEYLSGKWGHNIPFQKDELSEPLLQVYTTIKQCIEHGVNYIQVTKKNVTWIKDTKVIRKWPDIYIDRRSIFERVRARDEVIGRHLKVIEQREDSITYEIV
jgi:hypothetical protein